MPGFRGPRSFALPEFDPFWELVQEKDVVVGMHASDSGYQRYINEWEGVRDDEFTPFSGGSGFAAITGAQHRSIIDTVASAIGHGLCTRFPRLKITPVENGSGWVRPLLHDMGSAYDFNPHLFEEDPVEVFKRNIFVHPFHEDDPVGLVRRDRRRQRALRLATTRTPRACPTRSASSTTSRACPPRTPPRSWAATSAD